MSDYCTDDGLPDEDAVFNVLLNANNPILLKGAGELVMLSGNATFLRRIAGQTFSQLKSQLTTLNHIKYNFDIITRDHLPEPTDLDREQSTER